MTEVVHGRADTAQVGRPRRDRDEPRLIDQELADRLIELAQSQGVELLGEGGLLKQMTKAILERSMTIELSDHLGYDEGDPAGAGTGTGTGNSRNRTTPKRLLTEAGHIDLEVPRDRNRHVRTADGKEGPAAPRWCGQARDGSLRARDESP